MSKYSVSKSLAVLAALSVLAVGSAASAQGAGGESVSVKVKFADLNVSSEAGAKALLRRIRSAAREACGLPDVSLAGSAHWVDCINDATDQAVDKLDVPMVSAMNGSGNRASVRLASARR